MKKGLTAALIITLIIAAAVAAWWVTDQSSTPDTSTETTQSAGDKVDQGELERTTIIQYQGEDGKTALDLLEERAEVDMSGSGEMAFVTAINGVEADANTEFWAFLVNGEMANVGAGQYETSSNDTITWELQTINSNSSASDEN